MDSLTSRPDPDFKIFTNALVTKDAADGRKVISCTASSSVVDLHGDEITAECVEDMSRQALAKGMTIFLNHSYRVPEDTFGQTVGATARRDAGNVAYMDLDIEVDEENPRALQTYRSLQPKADGRKGLRLGVSIGAQVTDWEFRDAQKSWEGGIRIKGVNLLEASIVGIPANPLSWVQNAVKSLRSITPESAATTLDATPVETTHEVETTDIADTASTETCESCGHGAADDCGCTAEMHRSTDVEAGDVIASDAPDVASVEADVTTASEELAEPPSEDSGSPAPSAPEGESREDAGVDDVDVSKTVDALRSIADGEMSDADRPMLAAALATLNALAEEVKRLQVEKEAAEAERDAMVAARETAVKEATEAAQIVAYIASLPLGRKTRFAEPVSTFRQKFSGIYDEGFLRLIDERQNPDG